ncbi:MAG TPA: SDR family NAD(P)-dependent oxidoreductase [Candidatus Limnocylindrales bacterium]|nr:SDR family NAD(P)-dependent oxidoreductase [Candidatus Limnocylindrales bacterium]
MQINNSVAVITGAGSGIGRALAIQCAQKGAQLALADANRETLDETFRLLGKAPARTYLVDVGDASAMQNFAGDVQRDFGRASLLINNAGVALYGTFAELTLQEFEWLFRINFWGVIHGCKFFLPILQQEKQSRIVNISSVFGLIGPPGQTPYASSKFAVRGFSESLRGELRATSVGVTCVHPGGIRTNIANNGRAGSSTDPQGQQEARALFNKIAHSTPEYAAHVIISGIEKNKDRVLIGKDAYQIDRTARLFPNRAGTIFANYLEKRRAKVVKSLPAAAK